MTKMESVLKIASTINARRQLQRADTFKIVPQVRQRKLSYLSDGKILQIVNALNELNDKDIKGSVLEAGCALGGSLIVTAAYAMRRAIDIYDTFEMIPPPTEDDPIEVHERYATIVSGQSEGIDGEVYYGYRSDLLGFVRQQVQDVLGEDLLSTMTFHKGLLQDTMTCSDPIAFAHIDVDWYDPVKFCLNEIWPALTRGGIVILDDYFDWGGCKTAVDEFFLSRSDFRFDARRGNLKVTKL